MQRLIIKGLIFILLISVSGIIAAQERMYRSDIENLRVILFLNEPDHLKRPFLYKDEELIKKLNPVGWVFGGTLYFYQNVLSKHISADCLFTPGCSDFSKEAIKETGLIRGTLLTIDRLSRCNRIAAHDLKNYTIDPVTHRYPDPVSRHIKKSDEKDKK
jgi:putative component of membrane protein insertase Oxa1/YidC/SpoIIIJ protein YidD